VCGSRSLTSYSLVRKHLDPLLSVRPKPLIIVHGAAYGADKLAGQWAELSRDSGVIEERHPAQWTERGKVAGFERNAKMAALGADLCIAFWDGRSNGTCHMMGKATQAGIHVRIVPILESAKAGGGWG
jgi:hypothetical protein